MAQFGIVKDKKETDSWRFRRLFMLWQMVFCKLVIGYVLWFDLKSSVAEISIEFSFALMAVIVLAYVFGATWDDLNKMNFLNRK